MTESQSSSDQQDLGGSDTTVSTIDAGTVDEVKEPLVKAESDNDTADNGIDDALQGKPGADNQVQPDEGKPEDKVSKMPPEESESDDESDQETRRGRRILDRYEGVYSSADLLNMYRSMLKKKSAVRDVGVQSVRLVGGLVGYMSLIETQLEQLTMKLAKEKLVEEETSEDKSTSEEGNKASDDTVIPSTKFFHTDRNIEPDGQYIQDAKNAARGTYICDRDPRYLIRVLYSWANEEVAECNVNPTSESPHANDIDIITFGVDSRPIAAFFEKILDITLGNGSLIRFEKPFKAVIRNFDRIKDQLHRLETNFGSVS